MRSKTTFTFRLVSILVAFAVLNSGCGVIEDILRALGRICETPAWTVSRTDDVFGGGICSASGCSLRQAIQTSNTCPGVQIVYIPAGIYLLAIAGPGEDHNRTGDLDITDSVNIVGTGNPVIDGNHTDRVFDVMDGATVDMTGLSIQNGRTDGVSGADGGAGIRNNGSLRIHASSIHNNIAPDYNSGGGILSQAGDVSIDGSQINGNSASFGGGIAIYHPLIASPLTFESTGTTIANNEGGGLAFDQNTTATLGNFEIQNNTLPSDHTGGGIYNEGVLNLSGGSIDGNHAGSGSGLYNGEHAHLTANAILVNNNASNDLSIVEAGGQASFSHSAIVNNECDGHACHALYVPGQLTLDNSTISGNQGDGLAVTSSTDDAGAPTTHGDAQIIYTTVAENTGFGIQIIAAGILSVGDSIVNGNCDFSGATPASLTSNGFNIDAGSTCNFAQASDLVNTDALLQPLASVGGSFVHTFDTAAPSPALDSADPAHCSATDQLGTARPQGPACDRGAWEAELHSSTGPLVIASATPTPAATPGAGEILLLLTKNANCRHGPGSVYPVLTSVLQGQQVQLIGRNDDGTWLFGIIPGGFQCWIASSSGTPNGNPNGLLVLVAPPTPTPTVTPKPAKGGIDFDKDGFPAGPDCNDKNAKIHPGAPETAKDGVDSNCNGDDDK